VDYSYQWKFDDGTIETGESIEHVFLRPQMRTVTLEVLKNGEVITEIRQKIHVHILWDKIQLEPKNIQAFEKAISESDFSKLPIGDVINLYAFADGLERQEWRQQAMTALVKRMDELVAESKHQYFCLELGQYLRSASVRQYEQALKLFTRLQEKSAPNTLVRQNAMVSQAELLVQCFGKAQEALRILNQLEERKLDKKIVTRFRMTKAETLIALEQVEEAREILKNIQAGSEQTDNIKQEVKDVGLLRHARLLADNTDDPEQLNYAMEKIEEIIANDPVKLLMPNLNLIKLDVHLARKEYLIAFYLAERLNKLDLSNYDRSEVLVRQIKALCGTKAVDQAKVIYETIATDYPYSPAVAEARKVIIETVVAGQKQ
jgi:tetratricopeptide (TPR) repeat protein